MAVLLLPAAPLPVALACLRGHHLEEAGCAVSLRPVAALAQDKKPRRARGAADRKYRVALMPRDGSLIAADLVGKLDWLVVSCEKCGRPGRYNVARLVERLGADAKMTDWLTGINADCPRSSRST